MPVVFAALWYEDFDRLVFAALWCEDFDRYLFCLQHYGVMILSVEFAVVWWEEF